MVGESYVELFLESLDSLLTSFDFLYFEVIEIKSFLFNRLGALTIPKKTFAHL